LIHAQHLSGVGHHVRMDLLARALARRHEVYVVDGGEPVPRRGGEAIIRAVPVPRIRRTGGAIVALAAPDADDTAVRATPPADVAALLDERARRLEDAVRTIRPDLLVVEHFPFSKWELADEILSLINRARAARPSVRIVCSVRDVVAPTRFESAADYARTVPTLNRHFDALLVHGDPRLIRLEDSFPLVPAIGVPIVYTGIVSEKIPGVHRAETPNDGRLRLVASVGGGSEGLSLARSVARAFSAVSDVRADASLTLFAGLFFPAEALAALRAAAERAPIRVEPFSTDFLAVLAAADVSLSRAGYNTCANVLEAGARCVLVPSAARSDQALRAARLEHAGIASVLGADPADPDAIAGSVLAAAAGPRPQIDFDLDGAARAATVIADLARGLRPLGLAGG
jgi:predicted glycosyltransferase